MEWELKEEQTDELATCYRVYKDGKYLVTYYDNEVTSLIKFEALARHGKKPPVVIATIEQP